MSYRTLLLKLEDGIATLRLNRPERRNAMSDEMAAEFASALEAVSGRTKRMGSGLEISHSLLTAQS